MSFPLMPKSPAGERFCALADAHAADFATRAAQHDRDASFPYENFTAMRTSGFAAACVPVELGGLGVTMAHDLIAGVSRLGRGDSSTTIGISMHLLSSWGMARRWLTSPEEPRPAEAMLRRIVAGEVLMAAVNSENGSDPRHPFAEATKVEGGWLLNGRKSFGTMSPAADFLTCAFSVTDAEGQRRVGSAMVPKDTPGMVIDDNWDAFGMRASGSHDILFTDCFIPEAAMTVGQPWGTFGPNILGSAVAALLLTSVFLGIAEGAAEVARETVMTRKRRRSTPFREIPVVRNAIAEIEIKVSACRAMLERTASIADHLARTDLPAPDPATLQLLQKEVQSAKHFVNHTAIEVCDRALTMTGGGGYLNKNPISRYYRDVRAGPFMSPLTAGDGIEYVGRVALGLDPDGEDAQ